LNPNPSFIQGSSKSPMRQCVGLYGPLLKPEDMRHRGTCKPISVDCAMGHYLLILYSLASFGGAGGQHACEIASLLGIKTILIHRYSSILSAYGLALADRCAFQLHLLIQESETSVAECTRSRNHALRSTHLRTKHISSSVWIN